MIKEPKRGRYDVDMSHENPKVKKQSEKPNGAKNLIKNYIKGFAEIFKNPCSRWTIIAGCLRFWAGNAVGYYTGKYFNIYPDKVVRFCAVKFLFKQSEFSYLNALALLVGGLISNMLCGYISDRYDEKNYMTKTYVQV